MTLVTLTSGTSFQSSTDLTILDSASNAGVSLPYSCKTGRCNACKAKVISGTTRALKPESGLNAQEQSDGWILSCVRAPETDVLLEADDLGSLTLPPSTTWPCRINEITRLASDVVRVILRLPPSADFRFLPGQHVAIIGPNGVRRSYSLANSTFADKLLELHIRQNKGGIMSKYWFSQAKPNDLLRLNGPLGTFFLRESTGIDLIFLATGTGIAPVKAILGSIEHLPTNARPKAVTTLWGGRTSQDFYLNLESIPGFHTYIPVQSRPPRDWAGARGYIQDVLLDMKPNLSNAAVYACGSDAMIRNARGRLVKAGLPPNRFYSDAFVCSRIN